MSDDLDSDDFMETCRKRFTRGLEYESSNRDAALEAIKFRNLEQWDPEIKNAREKDPEGARPCLVVDKTNQYLNQVINDYRQNRPSIRIRPVDSQGDPEVATVLQGLVRHIEYASGADLAYDTAYEQTVDGGFGYFRVLTEYCDEMSFDQDIRIKRIRNRFQVVLDPDRQEPDGSDAKWGFIMEKMPREEYKRNFPDADELDFQTDGAVFNEWIFKDYVVIAEYFWIEKKKAKLREWPDGTVTVKDSDEEKKYLGQFIGLAPMKPIAERETQIPTVKWAKVNAKQKLEERDWLGKHIPIVEEVGTEIDIEGKSVKSGLLKGAMQPQKMHNYAASSFVEGVALAPRASWVAAEGQIEGYDALYKSANRRSISVLPYKPVVMEGIAVPPPQRVQPPGISAGWQQALANFEHDISAAMGIYAQTLLGTGDANSGKQELLQQRRGDTATFHFADNSKRSIRHLGRILLDLIPKVYDRQRVARIIGEDGETRSVKLNPDQPQAMAEQPNEKGGIDKIYNLNVGKYDVVVDTGPGYTTKRQEAVDWMTQIMQADPSLMAIGGDILFRNMDAPGAQEWADRLRKVIEMKTPQLLEKEGEEAVPHNPEDAAVIAQLQQALQQAGAQMEEMQRMGQEGQKLAEAGKADRMAAETVAAKVEAARKVMDAEFARQRAELKAMGVEQQANVRDAVATITNALTAYTNKVELAIQEIRQEESEPEEGEDPAHEQQESLERQALISQLVQMHSDAQAMVAQALQAIAAPRVTDLEVDEAGNPIRSVSRVQVDS